MTAQATRRPADPVDDQLSHAAPGRDAADDAGPDVGDLPDCEHGRPSLGCGAGWRGRRGLGRLGLLVAGTGRILRPGLVDLRLAGAAVAAIAAKLGITFTGQLVELAHPGAVNEGWREAGDHPLPGNFNAGEPKKKRAPKDATYGAEPDMLDKPGVIVEPVVRKKISDYFTKMKLREMIKTIMSDNA